MSIQGKIGLEIHVYPNCDEKLFCKCKARREKGQKANEYICPICTGQPGAKPMKTNEEAVIKTVKTALMLGCSVENIWKWQRKHYSWPDMPKGFQNTVSGGHSKSVGNDGEFQGIEIESMHLEEDPASWDPMTGRVDYNRSGVPLIEIVTKPDFKDEEEVKDWLKKLIRNLSYIKSVDKNAGIKVDVNVSLIENGKQKTERVEIKNISSLEDIGKAIDYEIDRQKKEGSIKETRRFDSVKGKTERMRSKEEQDDYRFITDPDLEDVNVSDKFVREIEQSMPESPDIKLKKLIKKHKIGKYDAEVIRKNIEVVEFFEEAVEEATELGLEVKKLTNWVSTELLRHLNFSKKGLDELEIKAKHFVDLLDLIVKGKITEQQGKKILNKFNPKSFDPRKEIKGKEKITDEEELGKIIDKVLKENSKAVTDYKAGEENALNFLIGQVMALTSGRADNEVARKVLKSKLE